MKGNGGPAEWMQNFIGPWLRREDWDKAEFIGWLEGHGLPAVGHDDEPYLWILRGLPVGSERYRAEKRLAERVAHILRDQPDITRPGKATDRVLYNLLLLCAGLGCPAELADPLHEMYSREKLRGKWNDQDLRGCLRDALIENQADDRLLSVWEAMLQNTGHDYLPGGPFDALNGANLLPGSEPEMGLIGRALKAIALLIGDQTSRLSRFKSTLDRIIAARPRPGQWDIDLLLSADRCRWPAWAVRCLPRLFIPQRSERGGIRMFLWRYAYDCLPRGQGAVVERELCLGEVVDLWCDGQTADFIRRIAPAFEKNRVSNPYPSDRAAIGVALASVVEIGLDISSAPVSDELRGAVGGLHDLSDLDPILGPAVAKIPDGMDGETRKEELLQIIRDCGFPAWSIAYVESIPSELAH